MGRQRAHEERAKRRERGERSLTSASASEDVDLDTSLVSASAADSEPASKDFPSGPE